MPRQLEISGVTWTFNQHATLCGLLGLDDRRTGRVGTRRDRAEVPLHAAQRIVGIDVSHNYEDRVVGDVELAVVAVQVVPRHRPEILNPADGGMPVGVRPEGRRVDFGVEQLVGIVLATLELGNDHRPLGLTVGRIVEAARHPLGLDEQHLVQGVPSGGLDVGRLIDPRVTVPHPPEPLDDAFHLLARDAGGPLEIHVLHPVRRAGPPGGFVSRPHAVPAPDGHERRRTNRLHQHLQSVIEVLFTQSIGGDQGLFDRHAVHYTGRAHPLRDAIGGKVRENRRKF